MTAILASGAYQYTPPASVSISDQYLFDVEFGTAIASYSIRSDGTATDQSGGILEAWLQGGGTSSNYEVRATVTSGSLSSGTPGTWLNCGTTRAWALTNSSQNNSTTTCVLTVEIRLASSGVVQDSASITLSAESDRFDGGGFR